MVKQPTKRNTELRICVSILGNEKLYNEHQIVNSLSKIKSLVTSHSINLLVTDGVVSINYKNEELLGEQYVDDVHLILNDIFYGLADLVKGKTIERFLPMQSVSIVLSLENEMIVYKLQPSKRRREMTGESDIMCHIPSKLFIREFVHSYLLSVRLFMAIGEKSRTFDEFSTDDNLDDIVMGHSFKDIFQNWHSYIPDNIFSSEEKQEIQELMAMSLQ